MAAQRHPAKTPKKGQAALSRLGRLGCPGKPRAPPLPPAKLKVLASVLRVPLVGGGLHLVSLLNQVPEVMERGDRGPAIAIDQSTYFRTVPSRIARWTCCKATPRLLQSAANCSSAAEGEQFSERSDAGSLIVQEVFGLVMKNDPERSEEGAGSEKGVSGKGAAALFPDSACRDGGER